MKQPRAIVSGVLLLDKPAGISSNGALGRARRLFGGAKAGHTGTLDPFATGLLPLAFGEASKYSRFLLDATKGYSALLKLGETTTTGDPEGDIVEVRPVEVTPDQCDDILRQMLGPQQQIPPMHSALKRDGVPLYKLARQGIEVERQPRDITILALSRTGWDGQHLLSIDVLCSKGTYVRVLAEEIGRALGCGAHLVGLRRTRAGNLHLAQAVTLEQIEAVPEGERSRLLLGVDALAADLPELTLAAEPARDLLQGKSVPCDPAPEGEIRVYGPGRQFLGVVTVQVRGTAARLVPERMMSGAGPT